MALHYLETSSHKLSLAWLSLVSMVTMAMAPMQVLGRSVPLRGRRSRRRNDSGDDIGGGRCVGRERLLFTSCGAGRVTLQVDVKGDLLLDIDDFFNNGAILVGCGGLGGPGRLGGRRGRSSCSCLVGTQ